MAVVMNTFEKESDDTLIRKIQIKLLRNDKLVVLVRPVCLIISLLSRNCSSTNLMVTSLFIMIANFHSCDFKMCECLNQ